MPLMETERRKGKLMSHLNEILFISNYLHDFFAALLLVSALSTALFYRTLPREPEKETLRYFLSVYGKLVKLGWISLAFTLILGVPRMLSYKALEWSEKMGASQIPLLIGKHILLFLVVGSGLFFWHKLHKKVKALPHHTPIPYTTSSSSTEKDNEDLKEAREL